MTDAYGIARKRMVAEQIKGRGVSDERVLTVMANVPRHEFVDEALKALAYSDGALSIGFGQTISQPYIVALMTEAVQLQGKEKVLEIGTGCGYQTVVLASLCSQVHTIERVKSLAMKARERFKKFHLKNIVMRVGDGSPGWPEAAPFDCILAACAFPNFSRILFEQLVDGGIMVFPLTVENGVQKLIRIRKRGGEIMQEDLGDCRFVKLIGKYGYQD